MSKYEQKPSDIAIFKERDKRSDKAPDWKGTLVTQDGQKLAVALRFKSDTMLAGMVEVPRERDSFRRDDVGGEREGGMARSGRDDPFDDPVLF